MTGKQTQPYTQIPSRILKIFEAAPTGMVILKKIFNEQPLLQDIKICWKQTASETNVTTNSNMELSKPKTNHQNFAIEATNSSISNNGPRFLTMVQDLKCILASIPAKLYITDIYNDSVSPTMEWITMHWGGKC